MDSPALPLTDRPVHHTLLYDGDCGFCSRAIRWIDRHVHPGTDLIAWRRADLERWSLQEADLDRAVQWIGADGSRAEGAAALARVLGTAGLEWRIVRHLLEAPGVERLAAATYARVARHRHRLPGATDACRLG